MSPAAWAHDTWFATRAVRIPGTVVLALGTGNQFPRHEFPIGAEQLQLQGCRQAGRNLALTSTAQASTALLLQVRSDTPAPLTCWSQLVPFEIELEAATIPIYLDEIHAPGPVRQRWRELAAMGLPWRERYVKHARIEVPARAPGDSVQPSPAPVPMGMDVLLQNATGLKEGAPLVFQVLRDGAALADFDIELRGTDDRSARWFSTDADGRVATLAPRAGRWVLRGTDLRPSTARPDAWESRFVNLAFEVLPPQQP